MDRTDELASAADDLIRVFLLDDHEIVRRGLTDLLASEPGFVVVGECGLAADAMAVVSRTRPDVAILDTRLPDGSGIDVCRDIKSTFVDLPCVILTSYDDDDAVFAAVMAGAAGYLLKEVGGQVLLQAIRSVASGHSLLDPVATKALSMRLRAAASEDPRIASLSEREREVLSLITDGLTNRQIGEALFLAEKTVKNYVSVLLGKLGVERRTQAAVYMANNPPPHTIR